MRLLSVGLDNIRSWTPVAAENDTESGDLASESRAVAAYLGAQCQVRTQLAAPYETHARGQAWQ